MPRILFIDADSFLGAIYTDAFRAAGFDIEYVEGGHEGLRAAMNGPDLVVLDVMMPRMAAFEVLERLRNETATRHLPVVVFTDLGHRRDIERCRQIGISQYMMKGHHTPNDVVRCVTALLPQSSSKYAHI